MMEQEEIYACHDYARLVRRWRQVARAARLQMRVFAQADGFDLYVLTSRDRPPQGGFYFSAGIHGDEPAGTEGLLAWAREETALLSTLPVILFPCLNPWGLVHNNRLDSAARDLNRAFHLDDLPQIAALKKEIAPYRFALALTLHEDYDGRGFYLYEVRRAEPTWGDDLIAIAAKEMPIESRATIDGRRITRAGLFQRRFQPGAMPMEPEALYLHRQHARRTFTFETPSEFDLRARVEVQKRLISECVRRSLSEGIAAS